MVPFRMIASRISIVSISILSISMSALAENTVAQSTIDPSSALLLAPSSRATGRSSEKATEPRSDSTRYTSRPRSGSERPASERSEKDRAEKKTSNSPSTQSTSKSVGTESTPAPVVLTPTDKGSVIVAVDPPPSEAPTIEERTASSGAPVTVPSRHILDISIATAYLYENSESNYSFRQANMGGPAYVAGARAWLTPEFGAGGRFISTLGGQVADRGAAVSAARTEIAYGIYLRKTFAKSNFVFSAEYAETEFKVSSDTTSKLKTKSGGVRASIESEFQSEDTSWLLGFSVMPKLQHEEMTAGTEVRSGTGVNAYAISASIGRSWRFDSSSAAFVRLEHRLERDLFTGSATLADPIGGATPNGVAATIGTTLIQFGYSWGD